MLGNKAKSADGNGDTVEGLIDGDYVPSAAGTGSNQIQIIGLLPGKPKPTAIQNAPRHKFLPEKH